MLDNADRQHELVLKAISALLGKAGLAYHYETRLKNGVPVQMAVRDADIVWDVVSTPTEWRYRIIADETKAAKLTTPDFQKQIKAAVSNAEATLVQDGSAFWVCIPKARAEIRDVEWRQAWELGPGVPAGCVLLGINSTGGQLALDMTRAENWACMVIGMPGSGKTTLMQTMALSVLSSQHSVMLCDPEHAGGRPLESLWPLSGHPLVWGHGLYSGHDDVAWALGQIIASAWHGLDADLYLVLDEVPQLTRDPRIRDALNTIAMQGRKRRLHLIMGAQHIIADDVPGATSRNAPVRIVGRVSDRNTAYLATGRADTGAERLAGRGDMLAVTGADLVRFKGAYIPEAELRQIMERYRPRLATRPRVAPVAPELVAMPVGLGGGGHGAGGSDPIPTPDEWLADIRDYYREHGQLPIAYWLRQRYHVGAVRAERILSQARDSIDHGL